jgi:cysteine-S-conjugate beta-lyase
MKNKKLDFKTKLIHAAEKPDISTGAVAPILVRSKTFALKKFGKEEKYQYSRGNNPTREKLELKLAELEGGGLAKVFGSGIAAEAMFFLTLSPGDHIVLCQPIYGGTYRLLTGFLTNLGITHDFADFQNEQSIRDSIKKNTKYLFLETPGNPTLNIIDLELVRRISKETNIPFVVDATFAPPCTTQFFNYGAETVIHSLSKYIAGHNDILGGAVITQNKKLYERLNFLHSTIGAILSPDECYRVLQELKTLSMRWKYVSDSAMEIALFLTQQSQVTKVYYPGLPHHPNHNVAQRQMINGYGSVVSFVIDNPSEKRLSTFVNTLIEDGIITYAEGLSSPETILNYSREMSHKSIPDNLKNRWGIEKGLFRLSAGFENTQDIIKSLKEAFKKIK